MQLAGAAPPVHGCVGLSQVTCQLFPNVLIVPASCCPWACSGPWVSRKWMPQEQRNPIHGGWMWGPQRPFWSVSQTISQRVPAGLTPPSPLCGNLLVNTLYWLPPSLPHLPHSLNWAFCNHHPNQLLASLLLGRTQAKAVKCGGLVFGRKYKLY